MITLSNNLSFNTIYSSGSLSYDGNGWLWERPLVKLGILPTNIPIITKTITLFPNKGKPYAVRFIKNGVQNQIGLHNKGIHYWINNYYPKIKNKNIIVSISGDYLSLIRMVDSYLNKLNNIKGIEINISCPNVKSESINDVIRFFKKVKTNHPLLLKINNNTVFGILKNEYLQEKVQAISINSYATNNGGISGKCVQKRLWSLAKDIKEYSGKPVIFSSCWSVEDIDKVKGYADVDAISLGSVVLRHPFRIKGMIKEMRNNC